MFKAASYYLGTLFTQTAAAQPAAQVSTFGPARKNWYIDKSTNEYFPAFLDHLKELHRKNCEQSQTNKAGHGVSFDTYATHLIRVLESGDDDQLRASQVNAHYPGWLDDTLSQIPPAKMTELETAYQALPKNPNNAHGVSLEVFAAHKYREELLTAPQPAHRSRLG